jgi:predicted ester cyclase
MSVERNKALARRFFEEAPQNPSICDEIFAPAFQFHAIHHVSDDSDLTSTPQYEKEAYERHKSIWGDWQTTIEEIVAEGDRVVVRWTHYGMQQGEYYGLPPTGKQVSWSGISIFRMAENKIAEVWNIFDRLWLWQQLGVLPELKKAIATAKESQ